MEVWGLEQERLCKTSVSFHCSRLYVFKDALHVVQGVDERKSLPTRVVSLSLLEVESVSFYEIESEKEKT